MYGKEANTHAESLGPIEAQRAIVARGITFEGKIRGKGDLLIQGDLKGEICLEGHEVSIEEEATVEADIQAKVVAIRGQFKGKVAATGLVEIQKTGRFEGELKARRLRMEDGAKLKGTLELQAD